MALTRERTDLTVREREKCVIVPRNETDSHSVMCEMTLAVDMGCSVVSPHKNTALF